MLAAGSIAGVVVGSAVRLALVGSAVRLVLVGSAGRLVIHGFATAEGGAGALAFGVRATLVVRAAFDTGFNVSRDTGAASSCGSGVSSTRALGRPARCDELGMPISTTMPATHTAANAIHHGSLRRKDKDPVACSTGTASAGFLDGLVCRAAVFFARTVRVGLSVFFVRTDTLLSVILCGALSA